MSGVPYWGTDIGGFFPAGLDRELYARWFQFGAFCPLFRSHGWVWRQHLPWAHGPEVEAVCRRYRRAADAAAAVPLHAGLAGAHATASR